MRVDFKKFSGLGMTSDKTRERLVLRLKSKGILNPSVLDALNKVQFTIPENSIFAHCLTNWKISNKISTLYCCKNDRDTS